MSRRSGACLAYLAVAAVWALLLPGSANADHAVPDHWNRELPNGGVTSIAQMYFEDHTGSRWPVYASVLEWDKSSRIGAYYASANSCDDSRLHCINVYEGSYGATNWFGRTVYSIDGAYHFREGMYIQLNNSYSTTADQRRSIACHELGHGVGPLDESARTDSCMYGIDTRYFPKYPSQHDRDIIYATYDH